MGTRQPTAEQRVHLARRAERYGKAYKRILWTDWEAAEKACNRSPAWRTYREKHTTASDPNLPYRNPNT